MSVQLILLRPVPGKTPDAKPKTAHRFTRPPIEAISHRELFENVEKYVAKIAPEDRWNVFYTVANCAPGEIRKFLSQDILGFDIDHIDPTRTEEYVDVVSEFVGIPSDLFTVVLSGNGLHFLFQLNYQIQIDQLPGLQIHYKECLAKLTQSLKKENLPGKFDMILDTGRILRLPYTENRKPGQASKMSKTLQVNFTAHPLDLTALSGLPDIPVEDTLDETEYRGPDRPTDDEGILNGCEFLKWARDHGDEVKEPAGYAALSILPRLRGGRPLAKEYIARWTHSSSIAQWDADEKIDQALSASRPRTCKSINLHYGECQKCPYNGKVKSPISIQGPHFIPTETTGFYDLIHEKGGIKRVPNYTDLHKVFLRDTHYHYQARGKTLWTYAQTHYSELSEAEVKNFAETRMDPPPKENMRMEFLSKVKANRIKSPDDLEAFWRDSTTGKINLSNGVWDVTTKKLLPHSPNYGFRYVLPYAYDESATSPRFDQFLEEITLGRKHYKDVILDAMAASLIPGYDLFDAGFWWFQGRGRNGKSKLLDLMRDLVGTPNAAVMDAASMEGDAGRFRMADLDSKLLCILEEVNEKSIGSRLMGVIKNISSGGTVPVERKGKDPYQMKSTAKLVFTANSTPILEDTAPAVKRRFIIVPFEMNLMDPNCPVVRDSQIGAKLRGELPGIFNRVLTALDALMTREEFYIPTESSERIERMIQASDSVAYWIAECLDTNAGESHRVSFKEAYDNYCQFTAGNEVSSKTFALRLADRLGHRGETRKLRIAGHPSPVLGFEGIALRPGDRAPY
jgi:P4 family phage/plasmid primase-like protien